MTFEIIEKRPDFCPFCGEVHEIETVRALDDMLYKGEQFFYEAVYDYCRKTNSMFSSEAQLYENWKSMRKVYNHIKGESNMSVDKIFELGQEEKFWRELGTAQKMVLATANADGSEVSARMIYFVIMDGKLYFQTDSKSKKANQIAENQNVAVCMDNIQIEGTCVLLGDTEVNTRFVELMQEKYPSTFEKFTLLEDELLYAVTPTSVERWVEDDMGTPFIVKMDLVEHTYTMEKYEG